MSSWKIIESLGEIREKPKQQKLWVNATTPKEIKSKFKQLCRHSKYVRVASQYCKNVKGGKYYCTKKWRCRKNERFCGGWVSHHCEFQEKDYTTGKDQNTTINILLEEQKNSSVGIGTKVNVNQTSMPKTVQQVLYNIHSLLKYVNVI